MRSGESEIFSVRKKTLNRGVFRPLTLSLLPLNRARRFGADIIDHAVYPPHLVDDAVRYDTEKLLGQSCPVGRHGVVAGDGTDGDDIFVGSLIAHNAYAFQGQKYGKCLPELAIQIAYLDFFLENGISFAQHR